MQFAEAAEDGREYAIKFFLSNAAFLTEAALYSICFPDIRCNISDAVKARGDASESLGVDGNAAVHMHGIVARFLPQVEAICDSTAGDLQDVSGQPLPPCIVMEKGESLNEWSDRAQPDFFTALDVRIATRCCCVSFTSCCTTSCGACSLLGPGACT